MKPQTGTGSSSAWLRLLLAGLALNALLVLPAWWRDGEIGSVWLAPEAWLAPALIAWLPAHGLVLALRLLLAALLAFAIVAGAFDGLVHSVLGRPLNVFVDPLMLRAGFHLVDGSMGRWAAVAASLLVACAAVAIAWGVDRLLRVAAGPVRSISPAIAMGVIVASLLLALPWVGYRLAGVESQALALAVRQAGQLEATRNARARLLDAVDNPAFEARALPRLAGRDVYVVFIESYGASALDQPRYAQRMTPVIADWQDRMDAAGLAVVSGRFVAPTLGGQSWLSHATVLSGLPIDSELWYRMLLRSEIDLLSEDFRASGHTALNVSPAIVMDWPEGEMLGFDRIFAAADMGYEGSRLGWMTMPDEYTLHAFSRRIRPRQNGPVFAQIALISSHWPWHPVIEALSDPDRIGRGRGYELKRQGDAGQRPLWLLLDPERMRAAYGRSLAYSLSVTFEWAVRDLPEDALLIVLGDHQPVSLVTGRDAGASVPVHVISGDWSLLEPFAARGFEPGLLGRPRSEPVGMERLRHWLRQDFSAD